MFKNPCFRTPFDSQHAKESQKLLESARQLHLLYFFIILWEIELENVPVSNI